MTVTIPEAPVSVELTNKSFIDDQLWERLVSRIVRDEANMTQELAERIMDQALGFLRLCGATPNGGYSPSPLVDIGWHTFILYTKPYADFCRDLAGHFIHHNPFDELGVNYGTGQVTRTVTAMKAMGLTVDESLWANLDRDCADNECGAECSDAPCTGSYEE